MSETFHKFPHTPHLLWLGDGSPREDKILSGREAEEFLHREVCVEEKVDGANLGLSLGPDGRIRAQSRGNYLAPGRCHAQWNPLWPWLARRESRLAEALTDGIILFGEWCHARHTIAYDALPDWFLLFDVLDPSALRFWSSHRRNRLATQLALQTVPEVFQGHLQLQQVPGLIGESGFGGIRMEGLYFRQEREDFLTARAKVVSPEFKQSIEEHWSRRPLVLNRLHSDRRLTANSNVSIGFCGVEGVRMLG